MPLTNSLAIVLARDISSFAAHPRSRFSRIIHKGEDDQYTVSIMLVLFCFFYCLTFLIPVHFGDPPFVSLSLSPLSGTAANWITRIVALTSNRDFENPIPIAIIIQILLH